MSRPSENPLKRIIGEIHRRSIWQVLAIYTVSGWVVYEVVQSLTEGLGLPDWFPAFAFVLLLIGLPIVLATAFVQEGGPEGMRQGEGPAADAQEAEGGSSSHLLTWRNAILGGVAAFALWGLLAAGWLVFGGGQIPAGLSLEHGTPPESSAAVQQSVAVLPFENMSADPDNEYFSDGITEEILNVLTRIQNLRVPGRTSSFAFKDQNVTIQEIADTLDVTHVVEGSVRKAGNRVRITAQLIDARNDEHLWSDTYERRLEDVFAIQAEIARSITEALEVRLGGGDTSSLAVQGTDSPEAHDAYLRGRYFWNQRTGEGLRQAAEHFRMAIEQDSTYAEAWSGLADTYSVMPWWLPEDSLKLASLRSRALKAANRAVELAPDRAMSRTSLAEAHFFNGNWEEAEREFERAIELNPDYATAHHWYGEFLRLTGRAEDGIPHSRRAVQLDPVSRIMNYDLAQNLLFAGRFQQALEQALTTIRLDRSWVAGYGARVLALTELGRWDEALEAQLDRYRVAGLDTTGIREFHSCVVRYRETREPQLCDPPPSMAGPRPYAATGQKALFLKKLEQIIESGEVRYRSLAWTHAWIRASNRLDPRDDPRYQELMERVGITW